MTNVTSELTVPGFGCASFETPMSASFFFVTVVVTVDVSLAGFGSFSLPVIVAVFVRVPSAVVFRTIVIVAFAPFASAPIVHVTVALPLHAPCVDDADTSVTLPGSASVTTTFVASAGPLFVATIVYVTSSPTVTLDFDCDLTTERSELLAESVTVVVALLGSGSGSLPGFGSPAALVPVALCTTVPAAVVFTLIVTVAEAPLARLPRRQTTVGETGKRPLHEPGDAVAETSGTPAGGGAGPF